MTKTDPNAATPEAPDDLGAAWRACEAALPEGWWLQVDHGQDRDDCRAQAGPGVWSPKYQPVVVTGQRTPTAALRALTALLERTRE